MMVVRQSTRSCFSCLETGVHVSRDSFSEVSNSSLVYFFGSSLGWVMTLSGLGKPPCWGWGHEQWQWPHGHEDIDEFGEAPALTQTWCYSIWGTKPNPHSPCRTWRGYKLGKKEGGLGRCREVPHGTLALCPSPHKGLSSNGGFLGPAMPPSPHSHCTCSSVRVGSGSGIGDRAEEGDPSLPESSLV